MMDDMFNTLAFYSEMVRAIEALAVFGVAATTLYLIYR